MSVWFLRLPILDALVAIFSAALALLLLTERKSVRFLIPLSGGLPAGVAAFGLAAQIGWPTGIALAALGYGSLTTVLGVGGGLRHTPAAWVGYPLVVAG